MCSVGSWATISLPPFELAAAAIIKPLPARLLHCKCAEALPFNVSICICWPLTVVCCSQLLTRFVVVLLLLLLVLLLLLLLLLLFKLESLGPFSRQTEPLPNTQVAEVAVVVVIVDDADGDMETAAVCTLDDNGSSPPLVMCKLSRF